MVKQMGIWLPAGKKLIIAMIFSASDIACMHARTHGMLYLVDDCAFYCPRLFHPKI